MQKIGIVTHYTAQREGIVTLPANVMWEDVVEYHVKWDMLYLTLRGGGKLDLQMDMGDTSILDGKYPSDTSVYGTDGSGEIAYHVILEGEGD